MKMRPVTFHGGTHDGETSYLPADVHMILLPRALSPIERSVVKEAEAQLHSDELYVHAGHGLFSYNAEVAVRPPVVVPIQLTKVGEK